LLKAEDIRVPTKILVADDSATMRRVLAMTFAGEDASVVTVDSGDAALAKAAENPPDIVFADASMAGVDGYELARRIKANPNLARTAVILMASQHSPYDDGKGRAAGVDDHISKPFDTQSVIDRVGQVLSRPRAGAGAGETSRVAATPAAAPAAARPIAASPVAAPTPASPRSPMQTTRMGIGVAPVAAGAPVQAPPQARPAPQAAPVAPMRPAATTAPMMPAAAAPAASAKPMTATVPQSAPPRPAAAVAQASVDMAAKLQNLGLTREQIEGVLALSREVIEQVVWEVVPDLAEQLIREEIKRLTAD
jgi:CheY-like chemotaxis protein